jgi:hypothetical protein
VGFFEVWQEWFLVVVSPLVDVAAAALIACAVVLAALRGFQGFIGRG